MIESITLINNLIEYVRAMKNVYNDGIDTENEAVKLLVDYYNKSINSVLDVFDSYLSYLKRLVEEGR